MARLYTRTGDSGLTALIGGARVSKDSLRVCAYGDLDELNAHLGLIRTLAEEQGIASLTEKLIALQHQIFNLGSGLATPSVGKASPRSVIEAPIIRLLEEWIDGFQDQIPELKEFILPGGSMLNAHLHIARTVCRRAERSVVTLASQEPVDPVALSYLNRLSDLLFVMARYASAIGKKPEYCWKK